MDVFDSPGIKEMEVIVRIKLDEAADWRERQWADLAARRECIRKLNDQMLHLVDQAEPGRLNFPALPDKPGRQ